MAKRVIKKQRKMGCLLPILIFLVVACLAGNHESNDTSNVTHTAEPVIAAMVTVTSSPTAVVTEISAMIPSAVPEPTITPTKKVELTYVLNTGTKKFHLPSCSSVEKIKDKNKDYFIGTRDELITQGYSPCGNCHP